MLALSQLEPSRLLRRAGAPPPLLGKDIANLPTSQDPNSPDRLGPGAGLGFFFFFCFIRILLRSAVISASGSCLCSGL